MITRISLLLALLVISLHAADPKTDKVTSIPGLTFKINYDVYSGYLNANDKGTWKMHYWLVESKSDPANDPLLVWFNGGPGCSSFGGAFEELGPFYVDYDGQTLFENKYSWNAKANVLFLESPIGVGFSYDTTNPSYAQSNDEQSRNQNYAALKDFFKSFTAYSNRTFFLSGESYAGIYIPMLTAAIGNGINNGDFKNTNFKGAAIGNGYMHVQKLMNSLVVWSAYHGRISMQEWDYVKTTCIKNAGNVKDVDTYDFFSYLRTNTTLDFASDGSKCGDIVLRLISVPRLADQYNYYQDCFNPTWQALSEKREFGTRHEAKMQRIRRTKATPREFAATNTALNINYDSTDVEWGYPCWNELAVTTWANRKDVWQALHIDDAWQKANRTWEDCNGPIYNTYKVTYPDQTKYFEEFFKNNVKNPDFRFLVYNGDVDTVCNYLGDAWFIKSLADTLKMNSTDRYEWWFSNQTAGYVQRYTHPGGAGTIDLMTVKGAGHFVPTDRPGAARQMITNFMWGANINGAPDYNSTQLVVPNPPLATLLPLNVEVTTQAAGGLSTVFATVMMLATVVRLL